MASDQDIPEQFEMSIGDESIPHTMLVEISHMTLEGAIASGLFDLPDEPGMVGIPVTINLEIPWHLLYPPELPAVQPEPDKLLYNMADAEARRRRLTAVASVTESFRTISGPVADAEKAEFRDMLQATRRSRSQVVPPMSASDAEGTRRSGTCSR